MDGRCDRLGGCGQEEVAGSASPRTEDGRGLASNEVRLECDRAATTEWGKVSVKRGIGARDARRGDEEARRGS